MQEVCVHSQVLQVCHKYIGQISQGRTKQIGLFSQSVFIFSPTLSALLMHTIRDDLLEAVRHRSHVCFYPLEWQLLLADENRPLECWFRKVSLQCVEGTLILFSWIKLMASPSVWEHRLVESFRQGQAYTFNTCYISRCWHIADSLHFGFVDFYNIFGDSVTKEGNFSYTCLLFVLIQDNVLSTPFQGLSLSFLLVINFCFLHCLATPCYDYVVVNFFQLNISFPLFLCTLP